MTNIQDIANAIGEDMLLNGYEPRVSNEKPIGITASATSPNTAIMAPQFQRIRESFEGPLSGYQPKATTQVPKPPQGGTGAVRPDRDQLIMSSLDARIAALEARVVAMERRLR